MARLDPRKMKNWNTAVRIGAHLITLNLVIAILVAAYFLLVQKSEHHGPISATWRETTVDPE